MTSIDPFSGLIVGIAGKRVHGFRAFRDGSQTCCFCNIQFRGTLPEIFLRGTFQTVGRSAEADIIQVGFQNLVLGIGALQLHCPENFTDFTGRGLLAVSGNILDQLLCNRRTALVGVIDVDKHIDKGGESTLIIHAVMGVEPLVLGTDEGILHVLRQILNVNRNSLRLIADLIHGLPLTVFVHCVDVRVVGKFHLLDCDIGNVIPEVHDVNHQRCCHNGTGDNHDQKQRSQRRAEDRQRAAQRRKTFSFFRAIVQFRIVIRIFRSTSRAVVLPLWCGPPSFSGTSFFFRIVMLHSFLPSRKFTGLCCVDGMNLKNAGSDNRQKQHIQTGKKRQSACCENTGTDMPEGK